MATIKDFAALNSLSKELKQKEEARKAEAAERARREQEAQREADLFRRSIGNNIKPLPSKDKLSHAPAPPPPVARQHQADEEAALRESLSDEFSIETLLESDEALSYARAGIGADVLRKLRRGHWVIQGELDLHGLRTDESREALGEFLREADKRGWRCLRVVHGKGLGSVNKQPVLKNKVRNWLVQKDEVIAFCQATPADGGAGALVVLLKAQI
ncbi:Smr/MutS family protein [Noviherbaspirillum sedimenti]|uniref:DNA mismatch repair protein MutS n=1 Tax=Noviherbaspirillum sedimenti TaxID=2320865 RepID=A0A3A3GE84_9BURK|nr:Smr/MutS family protein [Noviherbaspirillum sedimenti]RJG00536.1 DNA mismatch repair protein MutS [Noviherbaspirillum sedimenti]